MKKMVRALALLLSVLLLCSALFPAASAFGASAQADQERVFTEADELRLRRDVFARIDEVLESAAPQQAGRRALSAADCAALLPRIREAVENSESYAPGTLRQSGDFLTWETADGFACCFDPRMEACLRGAVDETEPALAAAAETPLPGLGAPDPALPTGGSPAAARIGLIQPFCVSDTEYLEPNFALFGPDYTAMVEQLAAVTGGSTMSYTYHTANVDTVAGVLERCGVVIFESHGVTDYFNASTGDETSRANCSYLVLNNTRGITQRDMTVRQGPYGSYYQALIGYGYAAVSGYCLADHMNGNAPHSLLYMGICSGMATDGLFAPLRAKGVETVWGYSQPVYFIGEHLYMTAVLGGVCEGKSFAQAVADAKAIYGNWDPYYQGYTEEQCVAEQVAFPIVVSSEDPYPGHNGKDAVQTVYSTWSLIGAGYTVQAVSADESLGSVSVRGRFILAQPAEGSRCSGYRVIQGRASVRSDGDLFIVTPVTDCTVEISFVQKSAVTLELKACGETVAALEALEGDPVTLPDTAPEVPDWNFLGWTEQSVAMTESVPDCLAPGAEYPAANVVLYALYSRELAGGAPVYRLLTEAPADWEGEYVLSSSDRVASGPYVLCGLAGEDTDYGDYENHGCRYMDELGILRDGALLRNVPELCQFTVSLADTGYCFKNKVYNNYIANKSNYLVSYSKNYLNSQWSLQFVDEKLSIRSLVNTAHPYLACSNDFGFYLNDSSWDSLRLWKAEPGIRRLFASDPSDHDHTPGPAAEENRTEPSCTEPGGYDLVVRCSFCGAVVSSQHCELPALGHVWSAPVYQWTADNASVTASRSCARSEAHNESETVATVREVIREPSCTEEGEIRFTAVFENPAFETQIRTVRTPKLERVNPFTDISEGQYYYDPVLWAYYHEPRISSGTGDGRFGPELTCTRAQVVTFLWKAAGATAPEDPSAAFTDVAPDAYYSAAVLWAAEKGITSGVGGGAFGPDLACTRAQVVTFLWRFAGSPKPVSQSCPFRDVRKDDYFYNAVLWAGERGITSGTGDGAFSPNLVCTRGQIMTFLYRHMTG